MGGNKPSTGLTIPKERVPTEIRGNETVDCSVTVGGSERTIRIEGVREECRGEVIHALSCIRNPADGVTHAVYSCLEQIARKHLPKSGEPPPNSPPQRDPAWEQRILGKIS